MTLHEKEVSRQKQIWFAMGSVVAISVGSLILTGLGIDVGGANTIISAMFLALMGNTAVNLYTIPKGDTDAPFSHN